MSYRTVLLSGLILAYLSSCGNNETLTVIQSPPRIAVKEGETAQMRCCWGGLQKIERLRVIWITQKDNSSNDTMNVLYENRTELLKEEYRYSCYISGNCSDFNISNVSPNDAGVFICLIKTEIPVNIQQKGNGTQITVERTNNSSTAKPLESISITAVLIPLGAVMGTLCLCAFLCYWRKKKLMPYPDQTSGKVGMVIHEVPHGPGEEIMEQEGEMALAENEGSSRSSKGSTQWCAVPVYESFDYFAVQTSEDR